MGFLSVDSVGVGEYSLGIILAFRDWDLSGDFHIDTTLFLAAAGRNTPRFAALWSKDVKRKVFSCQMPGLEPDRLMDGVGEVGCR